MTLFIYIFFKSVSIFFLPNFSHHIYLGLAILSYKDTISQVLLFCITDAVKKIIKLLFWLLRWCEISPNIWSADCDSAKPYLAQSWFHFIKLFFFFFFVPFLGFDLVKCEEPGTPNYGYKIQDDGHFANTFVLYSCNPGYTLHGSSTLTCLSGDRRVWDKALPSCIGEITAVSHHVWKKKKNNLVEF